jgi:hypothetical protein
MTSPVGFVERLDLPDARPRHPRPGDPPKRGDRVITAGGTMYEVGFDGDEVWRYSDPRANADPRAHETHWGAEQWQT